MAEYFILNFVSATVSRIQEDRVEFKTSNLLNIET